MRGNLQQGQRPVLMDESIYRSREILRILNSQDIKDTVPKVSEPCQVGGFRHFTLYIYLDSTSTPDLIHIEPEFLCDDDGQWYTYKQGFFAALFYEDADCAAGIHEVFDGHCAGREIRFKVTGENVAASGNVLSDSKYFTISLSVEFWN